MPKPGTVTLEVDLSPVYAEIAAVQQQVAGLTARVATLEAPIPVGPPVLCSDFARDYVYWPPGQARDQAAAWLATHIGLTESNDRGFVLPGYHALISHYALDLSVFTSNADAQGLPDSYFVLNPDGTRRVQHIWNDDRWFWDLSQPGVRTVVVSKLVQACGPYDGLFLDEHTAIVQALSDVTLLLTALKAALGSKFVIVNTSQYSVLPGYRQQVLAAGSFCAELQWTSGAMRGAALWEWDRLIADVSAAGGISHLLGSIGTNGVHGDSDRELLWRLAAYWLVKRPGVYLDLMSKPTGIGDVSFSQWRPALAVDLGKPLDALIGTDMGQHGSPNFHAIVFSREYEKGWVYLRGQDGWDATTYDATTAVTITLPMGMTPLSADGTRGALTGAILLRNAEAAIVLK